MRRDHVAPTRHDDGFSLIELIVAMGIFLVFVSLFLGAVVGLARGTTKAQVTAEATTGVLLVFQSIDRQVRYADGINFPGTSNGKTYIEFRTPAASAPSKVTTCTQWRYDPAKAVIESRSWSENPVSVATPWAVKLATVAPSSTPGYPFAMVPAGAAGSTKQQFVLTVKAGSESAAGVTDMSSSFFAKNTNTGSPGNAANAAGASVSPVCQRPGGTRP